MEAKVNQIISQFNYNKINISYTWVESQLKDSSTVNYQEIYSRFLSTDLKFSCEPSDPNFTSQWEALKNNDSQVQMIFTEGTLVQVKDIYDISRSISKQIDIEDGTLVEEEFEKGLEENDFKSGSKKTKDNSRFQTIEAKDPDKKPGTRTLSLTLSDGFTTFKAFEYKPMPSLSPRTALGCKILVKNFEVLRGLWMLGESNIVVLGGEVKEWNQWTFLENLKSKLELLRKNPHTSLQKNPGFIQPKLQTNPKRVLLTSQAPNTKRKAIATGANVKPTLLQTNADNTTMLPSSKPFPMYIEDVDDNDFPLSMDDFKEIVSMSERENIVSIPRDTSQTSTELIDLTNLPLYPQAVAKHSPKYIDLSGPSHYVKSDSPKAISKFDAEQSEYDWDDDDFVN